MSSLKSAAPRVELPRTTSLLTGHCKNWPRFGSLVLLTVSVALLVGCGGGASDQNQKAVDRATSQTPGTVKGSVNSATSNDPAVPVVVRRCPSASAVSQAVGFSVKKQNLSEGDCAYLPLDPGNSGIGIEVLHPHNAFRDLTTLAAAKRHDRFGGGTAETESAEHGGGHITSFLQDTPQYGPGTFRAGENVIGRTKAEKLQTCDFFVLGTDGYPASVQAEAQKGGTYSYRGTVSHSKICNWATAILALAISR